MAINFKFDQVAVLKQLADFSIISDKVAKDTMVRAMATNIKDATLTIGLPPRHSPHQTVVSRSEYEKLAESFAAQTQRLNFLLRALNVDELKRLGLLAPDAHFEEGQEWNMDTVLAALDEKVERFNAAHARLTGKRKKIPETGSMTLDQSELALVVGMRQAGHSTQDILQAVQKERAAAVKKRQQP